MRRLGYLPAFDGIRGVAILAVLLAHAVGFPGGALGVDMFFVLSGFLITTLLLQEWDAAGAISLRRFYVRRALRLLPALGAYVAVVMGMVAFAAAAGWLDRQQLRVALRGALGTVFYVSNFVKATGADLGLFTHMWSLAEEEQFYFLWPIVLVLCLRRAVGPRSLCRSMLAVVGMLAIYRVAVAAAGGSHEWLSSSPDMRSDPIVIGCVAGIAHARGLLPRWLGSAAGRRIAWPVATVSAAAVVAASSLWPYWGHAAGLPIFEAAVAVLILVVLLDGRSLCARALRIRPLVYTGEISYSLYIWHGLVLAFAAGSWLGGLAALPLVFVVATLSRRLIELPFLRRKARYSQREALVPAAVPAPA